MTKEEMLRLLTAAYTGPGSAAEGTFAGDVLRACADGMAQLWSMEIDGLERRAFVSSAVGEWLTAVCADRGCVRKEGETDEELRARTLAALAATPASGNADHYAAWCGQAADILRVKVLPLARGNGTVDIVAVGREGKAPGGAAIREGAAVEDRRAAVRAAMAGGRTLTPAFLKELCVTLGGGERVEVEEDFTNWHVTALTVGEGRVPADIPALERALERLKPAHLSVTVLSAAELTAHCHVAATGGVMMEIWG